MSFKTGVDGLRIVAVAAILVTLSLRWADIHDTRQVVEPVFRRVRTSDLALDPGKRALIIVTASYCHFCRESMAFYRTLVPLARQRGFRIVAATAEDAARNRAYLSSNGVVADAVISVDSLADSIQATPTLILSQSDGLVIKSWVGKLASRREDEVRAALALP